MTNALLIAGLPGAGKTSVAAALSSQLHAPVLSTDHVRDESLLGPSSDRLLSSEPYQWVAQEMRRMVDARIPWVIIDSSLVQRPWIRNNIAATAEQLTTRGDCRALRIWLQCSPEVLASRIRARSHGLESAEQIERRVANMLAMVQLAATGPGSFGESIDVTHMELPQVIESVFVLVRDRLQ